MTKEEAIKYLQQIYPNGGHCWLDEQRMEAIGMAINALQEEPVSVWHNMDEVPIKGKVIVVQTKDTFYGLSVQKGGTTYKNKNKDRYVKWAYASDLLNLSNVERTVKNWKEEPVAPKVLEDMLNAKTAAESLGISQEEHDRIVDELIYGKEPELVDDLSNKEKEPVSEELEEAARRIATRHSHITGDTYYANDAWFFKKGAQWQKKKTLSDMKKAVAGKVFQFSMKNVEARGDDPNGKTVTLEGPVTFHINNPESVIDALIAL